MAGMDRIVSGLGQSNAPPRASHVGSQLDRLMSATKNQQELISQLEQRLAGIIRNEPSALQGSEKTAERQSLVPHAEVLAQMLEAVQIANRRLESLIDRIEL